MTATITALIQLAVDHGLGVAFLIVGGQVLLERLNPVEHVVAHVFGSKRPTQAAGAHRLNRAPRQLAAKLTSNVARHRNEPIGCCTE
jgi:hypothetical protein